MANRRTYYVYIMASRSRVLYTGVTNNLAARIYQHKQRETDGFTKQYYVTRLVYFEAWSDIGKAIGREKQIKGGLRKKKVALIESMNPKRRDLSEAK